MLTDQLYVVLFIKEEVFNLQVSVENKISFIKPTIRTINKLSHDSL